MTQYQEPESIIKFHSHMCPKTKLFPKQREILETFYDGIYRELVIVAGRRAGKDYMCSLISLYEAYRLLQINDPYQYYRITAGNPIYLLNVACSTDQSKILFNEIKTHVQSYKYFSDKVGYFGANEIHLLTKQDKIDNDQKRQKDHSQEETTGSIRIQCTGANSESLLGKRIFTLVLNEVASFKPNCQHNIHNALIPATADFINPNSHKLDSKIITISSPRCENDILHKLYTESNLIETRYAVQYATWEMNLLLTREQLRREFKSMSENEFQMEFGAQFMPGENQTISLRLTGATINALKRIARKEAFEEDEDVSYIDIIREAINNYLVENKV